MGEEPSLALRMTRRTGSGWQGIPGRAGNDGEENRNDGGSKGNGGEGEHWKRWGEASWKDKGGEQWKGQGFPVEPGMTRMRTGMTGGAKGMTERVNIGKDVERPVGKTKGRTVESEKEVRMKGEER